MGIVDMCDKTWDTNYLREKLEKFNTLSTLYQKISWIKAGVF